MVVGKTLHRPVIHQNGLSFVIAGASRQSAASNTKPLRMHSDYRGFTAFSLSSLSVHEGWKPEGNIRKDKQKHTDKNKGDQERIYAFVYGT